MSTDDVLLTLAEISVAFVGFSALVVVFRRSQTGHLDAVESRQVFDLIGSALAALIYSLLPFAFFAFEIDDTTTWRVGSGLQAVGNLSGATSSMLAARKLGPLRGVGPLFLALSGLVIGMLALNAAAVVFRGTFGPYLIGIMWSLCVSGFMLVSIVGRRDAL